MLPTKRVDRRPFRQRRGDGNPRISTLVREDRLTPEPSIGRLRTTDRHARPHQRGSSPTLRLGHSIGSGAAPSSYSCKPIQPARSRGTSRLQGAAPQARREVVVSSTRGRTPEPGRGSRSKEEPRRQVVVAYRRSNRRSGVNIPSRSPSPMEAPRGRSNQRTRKFPSPGSSQVADAPP